jgi:hypothetical protein
VPKSWLPELQEAREDQTPALSRHYVILRFIREGLDRRKSVEHQPSGTAKHLKLVGESGPEPVRPPMLKKVRTGTQPPCVHPIGRRIAGKCMECEKDVK